MFIRNIFIASLILLTALVASSCHDEPGDKPAPQPTRTVIVYMVANNNLGTRGYDRLDLEEMRQAAAKGAIPEGSHLIVYHAGRQSDPKLIEITATGDVAHKTYTGGYKDGLSLTPGRMRQVLADAETLAPADSYGLVLWSHGSGWIDTPDSRSPLTADLGAGAIPSPLSFGDDYGAEMKVTTLADALSGRTFDFIYFDCCLMGSVEVAYELREAAPVIVASPTELQVYGMRYDRNIPVFFDLKPDMKQAAANTYSYYAEETDGMVAACSMAVVETAALGELASATRAIMATGALPAAGYKPVRFYNMYGNSIVDMADYIESLPDVAPALKSAWRAAYDKAVVYKAATPWYGGYDLSRFGGIACALMSSPADTGYRGYHTYGWYKDVVSHNPSLIPATD